MMFRFIDLFAGLGGFHVALSSLGGECVFASELDEGLRSLYFQNFGLLPAADIRDVQVTEVPNHDVLCAGFPCQSFSKAGYQEGLSCEKNGDLIDFVFRIIEIKKPQVFMLENVPNLLKHDGGKTWLRIFRHLSQHYEVSHDILSPDDFGIPQVRERVFIVGARKEMGGLGAFTFPAPTHEIPDLKSILFSQPSDAKPLTDHLVKVINTWNEFVRLYPKNMEIPSFPIWAMEFGATYPVDGKPPLQRTLKEMRSFKGSFGQDLSGVRTFAELTKLLPHHAHGDQEFPAWKKTFILQNRDLWQKNKHWIEPWLPKPTSFVHSFQKFEWNCKGCERDVWKHVLQVRASGLRVKRPTTAPSLIAMTTTQVPIIAWERRYMTARECAALQSMEDLRYLPDSQGKAYKALGNAVNVKLVRMIADRLLHAANLLHSRDNVPRLLQVDGINCCSH